MRPWRGGQNCVLGNLQKMWKCEKLRGKGFDLYNNMAKNAGLKNNILN